MQIDSVKMHGEDDNWVEGEDDDGMEGEGTAWTEMNTGVAALQLELLVTARVSCRSA